MIYRMKYLFYLIILVFIFTSCSKDKIDYRKPLCGEYEVFYTSYSLLDYPSDERLYDEIQSLLEGSPQIGDVDINLVTNTIVVTTNCDLESLVNTNLNVVIRIDYDIRCVCSPCDINYEIETPTPTPTPTYTPTPTITPTITPTPTLTSSEVPSICLDSGMSGYSFSDTVC